MQLTIFNVEHGACALLMCDNGNSLMIDCGHNAWTGWMPGDHLQSIGIDSLSMLFITNYDEDHVSGFRNLDASVGIDWMVRNQTVSAYDLYQLKSETGMGYSMQHLANRVDHFVSSTNARPDFPGVKWKVFHNNYPSFDDENNLSMVVSLTINGVKFLFPGDMERAGWINLLSQDTALCHEVANTDVLIASHHGRENGICSEMFDQLGCKPYIVIISDDYHKYNTQQTVQYYASKAKGISFRGRDRWVLTTRNDNDVTFTFTPRGWYIN